MNTTTTTTPINNEEEKTVNNTKSQQKKPYKGNRRTEKPTEKPDLRPKHLATTYTQEKNDPMLKESVLLDGISGFSASHEVKTFKLDFSAYLALVESSYTAACGKDRGLGKLISLSMWSYYMTIVLYKRLYKIASSSDPDYLDISEQLDTATGILPVPEEIVNYLNGVGHITDYNGRQFKLVLNSPLSNDEIVEDYITSPFRGSFGKVTESTHLLYETIPAPGIVLLRIIQDVRRTVKRTTERNWNLPANLRPPTVVEDDATYTPLIPNVRLLGWAPAVRLADGILPKLEDVGITEEGPVSVRHVANVPIVRGLLSTVADYFTGPKSIPAHQVSDSVQGSLSQTAFTIAASMPDDECVANIVDRSVITCSYSQASAHIASGASVMMYRFKRVSRGEKDTIGYIFKKVVTLPRPQETHSPPTSWINNSNGVFEYGQASYWNKQSFGLAATVGKLVIDTYVKSVSIRPTRK